MAKTASESVRSDGTVCSECGGSGELPGRGYYAGSDNMDFEVGEPEQCGTCAGTGWERVSASSPEEELIESVFDASL